MILSNCFGSIIAASIEGRRFAANLNGSNFTLKQQREEERTQLSNNNLPDYAIISPVRDEQHYIRTTLNSVVSQTILPLQWVIVDDGSVDMTPAVVSEYMERYPWIHLVHRRGRGDGYRLGGGVVEALYEGLGYVDLEAVDFICKLDGDIGLDPDYFEQLLRRAAADPKLGILSGVTYFMYRGRRVLESVPTTYAIGMVKFWRVACFRDIGGLVTELGWDVLDVFRAQMRGWKTRSYSDLQILHLRPMSSKQGWYKGRVRNGLTAYLLGYHPLFEIARDFYRMLFHPPYFIGGLAILFGYIRAAVSGEEQIVTAEERDFIQRQQLNRLFRLRVR